MARGKLRIYLGAAPGVGKTYAMLALGNQHRQHGGDVVIGLLETHDRAATAAQVDGLEHVPPRRLAQGETTFEEMDVDAVIARAPQIALVDEYAHSNAPGGRNAKRWQDVENLLDAGIDVVSTLNIQHLESLTDVVERITGIPQTETVPDAQVRAADQIELVDLAPDSIRRRLSLGLIYDGSKMDAALGNYFRAGNLGALRELALLWLADRVDEHLEQYKRAHDIIEPWETRERVLVAMTGAPNAEHIIRRAGRLAARAHGDLFGVHVVASDGLRESPSPLLKVHRTLLEELGGEYREVLGDDPARSLLEVAQAEQISQIVLGATGRSRWQELTGGSVINAVIRGAKQVDVHVIAAQHDDSGDRRHLDPVRFQSLPRRRVVFGGLIGVLGVLGLTMVLQPLQDDVALTSAALLYLAVVTVAAAVGGVRAGVPVALGATLLLDFYWTAPFFTLAIADRRVLTSIVTFGLVSLTVSLLTEVLARRNAQITSARRESLALAGLAGTLLEADDPLQRLVHDVRRTFDLDAAAVLRRADDGWDLEAADGEPVPTRPEDGTDSIELDGGTRLVLVGPRSPTDDLRLLAAFAAQVAVAVLDRDLAARAAGADALAASNELRAALLAAVSHDLRTPLASIKASASTLLQTDVTLDPIDRQEFIEAIVRDVDHLNRLVGNLLDMSRLQVGAVEVSCTAIGLEEVVPAALRTAPAGGVTFHVAVDESLPRVQADPGLLERVIANLVSNAVRWSPPDSTVRLVAGAVPGGIDLRVVDHGSGIPEHQRDRVFRPFQGAGDRGDGGVGLGLAVARGFTEAMGGSLEIDDTPGGGTTMVVHLHSAEVRPTAQAQPDSAQVL